MKALLLFAGVTLTQAVPLPPATYRFETHARTATGPICTEQWTLRADGSMTVRSGQEVLEKRYRFADDGDGMRIVMMVLSTNAKPDCTGTVTRTPSKTDRSLYLLAFNDGHVEVCPPPAHAPDGSPFYSGCYATLRPIKP